MKPMHLHLLRLFAVVAFLFTTSMAPAKSYVFPIKGAIRICKGKETERLEDTYFAIDVVTEVQGQPNNIMFTLKPDEESGIMSDCIWFGSGEACYFEDRDLNSLSLSLYSLQFPNQFVEITKELSMTGLLSFKADCTLSFYYLDDNEKIVEADVLILSEDTYSSILELVKEQIRQLGIPEGE